MKNIVAHEHIRALAANSRPLMVYDEQEDYVSWQTKARGKLLELLKLPEHRGKCIPEILSETKRDSIRRIDFQFESEPGYYVKCSMLLPDEIKLPAPAVICLQGHSTGMHISLGEAKYPGDDELIAGDRDFALRAAREGFCAIAMEQRYMGESGNLPYGKPACSGFTENASMAALLLGRTPVGERVWDISRLIDVLENHFSQFADCSDLICMGHSGGGTATFYAACVDERIKLAMPSGAVCTYDASVIAMNHCPCNCVPDIRKYFNMGDLCGLIAPRRLVVVSGIEDEIFPIEGAQECFSLACKLYSFAGAKENCYHVKGQGGHIFFPDEAWENVHRMLS